MSIIFFPDDTGIRTYEKTLRLMYIPVLLIPHQVCTYHQVLRCWITTHAQLRSVRLNTAQQRSVAPCEAVRCGAVCLFSLRCCVELRCVLSVEHRAVPGRLRAVYYFSSFFFYLQCIRSRTAPCFSPTQSTPALPIRT